MRITRRKFLILVASTALAIGIGSYLTYLSSRLQVKRQLKIYNYSYYIDPSILDEFSREYNVEIIYDEYEAAEEAWSKILVGGGGYDLIILTDSYVPEAIRRRLVLKLDHSKIPNIKNIDETFFDNPFSPGLEYAIPYAWGTTGIGVNYYYLSEVLPNVKVDSWAYLFDEEKLKLYPKKVSMLEEFVEVVMSAKIYLGIDLNDWSDEAIRKIIDLLKRQKPYLAGYWGASLYIPGLVKGEIYLAQAWSGDVLWAREEFAKELEKMGKKPELAKQLQYVVPKEGVTRWTDFMVIPKGAKNIDLAYEFINFILEPRNAAKITNYTWYPTALKLELVKPYLRKEVLEEPAVYPPPELMKKLYFTPYSPQLVRAVEKIKLEVRP